jgi:DNA-binding CsgD family transcriptional regulator
MKPLDNFAQQSTKIASLSDLNNLLNGYMKSLNVSMFSFTYYSYHPNSPSKIKYEYSSAKYSAWHQHYLNEKYHEIDSTFDSVYYSTLPTCWTLQQQLQQAKNLRERQMRLDSIQFGAEKGISIPIHGPNEDFANFLVVQMKNEKCLENNFLHYELLICAHFYYHAVKKLLILEQKKENKYQLSRRELQCLQLVSDRKSVSQIAALLKITERTVNFHIQNLNKKLGTSNKYQTVAKVLEKGLLEI